MNVPGWKLLTALIPIMLVMGACGQSPRNTAPVETEATDATEAATEEAIPEQPDEASDQVILEEDQEAGEPSDDDQETDEPEEDDGSSARAEPQRSGEEPGTTAGITDAATAIEFLKDELNVASEGDIQIDDGDGKPKTDEKGSYYILHLISKTLKEEGGTGEVGSFRIYEDGRYEMED